jgi:hypothetical protein
LKRGCGVKMVQLRRYDLTESADCVHLHSLANDEHIHH